MIDVMNSSIGWKVVLFMVRSSICILLNFQRGIESIEETTYWTTTNIANGLNALAICVEMVFFSALMFWAYTWKEYKVKEGMKNTSIWRPLWDSYIVSGICLALGIISVIFFMIPTARKLQCTSSPNYHIQLLAYLGRSCPTQQMARNIMMRGGGMRVSDCYRGSSI